MGAGPVVLYIWTCLGGICVLFGLGSDWLAALFVLLERDCIYVSVF